MHSSLALIAAIGLVHPHPARGAYYSSQDDSRKQPINRSSLLASTAKDCRAEVRSPSWCASALEVQLLETRKRSRELIHLRSLRGIVRLAKLELIRAYHRLDAKTQRDELVRELISTGPVTNEEILSLGPELTREVEREQLELDKTPLGSIRVECGDACAVLANEMLVDQDIHLPYGVYRVVVYSTSQDAEPAEQRVFLNEQTPSVSISIGAPLSPQKTTGNKPKALPQRSTTKKSPPPKQIELSDSTHLPLSNPTQATTLHPTQDAVSLTKPLVRPVLPRPLVQASIGIGLTGTIAGSVLLALDGECWKPRNDDCTGENNRLHADKLGVGLLLTGAAFLISTTIVLIVERARGKRAHEKWMRRRMSGLPFQTGFSRQ